MTRQNRDDRLILLTGATGYVGGRLLRVLEHQGHREEERKKFTEEAEVYLLEIVRHLG